jgi:hypothetical protein
MVDQRGNVKKTVASPAATLKRNKNGKPIFEGQLAEPITYPPRPLADLDILPEGVKTAEEAEARWRKEWSDQIFAQRTEKLLDLLKCYGLPIDPPDWFSLAVMLAEDFVPGFTVKDPNKRAKGAPKKTSSNLLGAVDDILQRKPELSVAAACRALTKKKGPWHRENAGSLASRYGEKKKERLRWAELVLAIDKHGLLEALLASPSLLSSGDPEPSSNRRKPAAKTTSTKNRS